MIVRNKCYELYSGKTAVCTCDRRHHKCGFCNFEKSGYPEVASLKDGEMILEPYLPDKYIY